MGKDGCGGAGGSYDYYSDENLAQEKPGYAKMMSDREKEKMLAENLNTDSTYKVPLTKIVNITPHTNADALEIAWVYGFQVVVKKDSYKVGDTVVYIPVDSIISEQLEKILFPLVPNADGVLVPPKIKLRDRRIRQIRIRKFPSQGMLVNPKDIETIVNPKFLTLEQDLQQILNITKYEPPERNPGQTLGKPGGRKKQAHPDFHSYNGLGNIKWFPDLFQEGEMVVIQEKLHGTNARAAKLPFRANTLWKKIKKYFGFASEYENLYGSNRVDITNTSSYNGYYGEDIYGKVFSEVDVFTKLLPNETVFGEIIGPGIQKGYNYSLKNHEFVLFDVKVLKEDGKSEWLPPKEVQKYAEQRGFNFVPVLYEGPFNKALVESLMTGPSVFDPKEKVREGIVVKAAENYSIEGNKKAVKAINPVYLDDQSNTDNH